MRSRTLAIAGQADPNARSRAFGSIPDAAVVLVTYPQVVPAEGAKCAALELDADEATYVRQLGQELEAAFQTAATASDVITADAYGASTDHGPCATEGDRWMNGKDAGTDGFSYHPSAAGHRAMADLVMQSLAGGS